MVEVGGLEFRGRAQTVRQVVASTRHRQFLGRRQEVALLEAAIQAESWPHHLIYLFGVPGVGRTALLEEYARICESRAIPVVRLECRDIEPTPTAVKQALATALWQRPQADIRNVAEVTGGRWVLFIDNYEMLTQLAGWMCRHFLPDLPATCLVVVSSRRPPSQAWRLDNGWAKLVKVMRLGPLSLAHSRELLRLRGVPAEKQAEILRFAGGHPLALTVAAHVVEQGRSTHFEPQSPAVFRELLEQFLAGVDEVGSPAHRTALDACALLRMTSEDLLAHVLEPGADVAALFGWLRSLSFVDEAEFGLRPHDLVRAAIVAELRWRNPARYDGLRRKLGEYLAARIRTAPAERLGRALFDFLFFYQDVAGIGAFHSWHEESRGWVAQAGAQDKKALLDLVKRQDGPAAARLVAGSLELDPAKLAVCRENGGTPYGFLLAAEIGPESQLSTNDTLVHAARSFLQEHALLQPGERALLFRSWTADQACHSRFQNRALIYLEMLRRLLDTRGVACSFMVCRAGGLCAPLERAFTRCYRLPDHVLSLGGRNYTLIGHDWRGLPPLVWLEHLAGLRSDLTTPVGGADAPRPPARCSLSYADFAAAIRRGFRWLDIPGKLDESPLLQCRMVADAAGAEADACERVAALRRLLTQTAESLRASPRLEKCYDALHRTYLNPASSQEQASEMLGVPYSTFRRHLASGLQHVAKLLWDREIRGSQVGSR